MLQNNGACLQNAMKKPRAIIIEYQTTYQLQHACNGVNLTTRIKAINKLQATGETRKETAAGNCL